jgi:hypothetical protein
MNTPGLDTDSPDSAQAFAAAVDATLSELARACGGLSPLELVEEQRIRQALKRLLDCDQQLSGAELMVAGSTKQLRPHPLLKVEQELRKEITENLRGLCFRAPNRAFVDREKARMVAEGRGAAPIGGRRERN